MTFEEKYNRMKMDKFIKEYPVFSNIMRVIDIDKAEYKKRQTVRNGCLLLCKNL